MENNFMKPFKTFIFFIIILLLIFGLSLIFPDTGIRISEKTRWDFFEINQLISPKPKPEYTDISGILDSTSIKDVRKKNKLTWEDFLAIDTLNNNTYYLHVSQPTDTVFRRLQTDSIKHVLHPLDFPENDQSILHPFFRSLSKTKRNNELIRVLHFGDSQIEGDRVSSYIRNELQQRFGGSGVGLIPVRQIYFKNISLNMSLSDNWRNYTIKQKSKLPSGYRKFGILFNYSRFSDPISNQNKIYKARIYIQRPSYSYALARKYKKFRLFYSGNSKPCIAQMKVHDKSLDAEILEPTDQLKVLTWYFQNPPQHFELTFDGQDSPNIYGVALDNTSGVALDNIPMRGSSGLEFTKTNYRFFSTMYHQLNVKLILMQFGVNVVPYIKEDYKLYEKQLYRQLLYLKRISNNTPVILLGVSDMSRKLFGYYVSYPNIEKIRDAQKNAAFKAGCAFWDVYKAMGGENSMPSWVYATPPLAEKDFTHFTYKGSKVIAEMFTNALLKEYELYIKK
jgi:hypothetical protein